MSDTSASADPFIGIDEQAAALLKKRAEQLGRYGKMGVFDCFDKLDQAATEIASLREKLAKETGIVARIWGQLGSPSYEELKGRSIHDLIDELKVDGPT